MKVLLKLALVLSVLAACDGAAAEPVFVHLAEGFTSTARQDGIVAGQRRFSVPSLPEICVPLQAPARLAVATPEPLRLVRDQWFRYDRLVVVAVDSSGRVLPPVPIAVEVEEQAPEVLNLWSDMTADADGRVLPVRTGGFSFRLRTICEGHSAVAIVGAEVVDP